MGTGNLKNGGTAAEPLPLTRENLVNVLGVDPSEADEILALESGESTGDLLPVKVDEK